MSTGGITRQLAGECRLSDRVHGALVELIGEDGAAEVAAAIPERQESVAA
jgi:hypothetical protein